MAVFKIGRRVKTISRHESSAAPVGIEGVIFAIDDFRGKITGRPYPYFVKFGSPWDDGHSWHYAVDQLVPIHEQPERNTVVSWESLGLPFDPRRVLEGVS